ncbi:sulfatase [Spongiimicrobium sp. 3-5]|uniref:sulfatase family protein n=1 Tax=Spongiimicrobium sp. 3-5 TaxID=3332596 RepID=UPI00397EE957
MKAKNKSSMKRIKRVVNATCFLLLGCLAFVSCKEETKEEALPPPNILWLYVEDISPNLGCYGDTDVKTPNIDALASKGVRFTNTIMPAPVCSPLRSAIITGAMQTSLGTHNHHSSRSDASAINLPNHVKTLPELFKKAGYFTFNQGKDDYNFAYNRDSLYAGAFRENGMYGLVGKELDWGLKQEGQPYFGQIQLAGNKYIYRASFQDDVVRQIDPKTLTLPPYYPQTDYMQEEWASYLESVELTDKAVGDIIKKLKDAGQLNNTYVFFFSDHGMRLWRHKQFLYEGGIKVPFILTYFGEDGKIKPGTVNSELINGLDIGTTSLGLADIDIPAYTEGQDFLATNHTPRNYVISARDRCDFTIDRIRSVRTKNYKYIRNFKTDRPYMQPNYRDDWEVTQRMRKAFEDGELDEIQSRFWEQYRPDEELYNLEEDPHEINNLADDPNFVAELKKHRDLLTDWVATTDDQGQYPEPIEGLKFMYGIWGDKCVNPEYDVIKQEKPDLAGALKSLKN